MTVKIAPDIGAGYRREGAQAKCSGQAERPDTGQTRRPIVLPGLSISGSSVRNTHHRSSLPENNRAAM